MNTTKIKMKRIQEKVNDPIIAKKIDQHLRAICLLVNADVEINLTVPNENELINCEVEATQYSMKNFVNLSRLFRIEK